MKTVIAMLISEGINRTLGGSHALAMLWSSITNQFADCLCPVSAGGKGREDAAYLHSPEIMS